jgi:hypothetical protein
MVQSEAHSGVGKRLWMRYICLGFAQVYAAQHKLVPEKRRQ